jgi:chromosome segregation ATPase
MNLEKKIMENAKQEKRLNALQEELKKCHEEAAKAEIKTCLKAINELQYALEDKKKIYDELTTGYTECKTVEKKQKKELSNIKTKIKQYKDEWGQWMEGFMEECQKNKLLERDCSETVKEANMHLQLPSYIEIRNTGNTMLGIVKNKILEIPEDARQNPEMREFIGEVAQLSKDLAESLIKNDPDILIKIIEYYLIMFSKKDGLVTGL